MTSYEKVAAVVGWVRDKKSQAIAFQKKRALVKCLLLHWHKVVQKSTTLLLRQR